MDSQTKSAIKQLVLDLRHTLEDELTIVLRRYGLETDRPWSLDAPPERLTDPADRDIWQRIVAVVRRSLKEGRTLPQASQDYVRESAFTFLNRLVGLKCLEVRGIIEEVITTRDIYGGRSKAHREYRDEHPREARAADDALPACLAAACRRVNDELIGYLFDPDDDHSLVWPRYAVLKGCIDKINALDDAAWREDEIIGWIYQFYNAEEKVAIRKRGKPQTPHDVAVINQFFTPRWIVKFLVDNTLGRLWLEMHPDSPRVREKCDYLVPELLPSPQEGEGQGVRGEFTLDPNSPINNPSAPPRREWKPVTRIRLLDPACGTMHFGHYAMEVFDAIYRDARDRGEVEIDDERIPSAILEYNLYGVDIDRRAVQLAALSLFMKARTMHPKSRVKQVNLVVADATLPDSGIKKKFLARYAHDKRLQQAVAQVLDDMDQVAQVGSLLRVEERLRELLARAGHAAAAQFDVRHQQELPGFEPAARQMGLAEIATGDQAAAWTPHTTLQELRDDLRAFAREALQEHDVNAQLFATEADKAVRLLDVLMGKYDVVVMNPPYGLPTPIGKRYIERVYPRTWNDIYGAFLERSEDLVRRNGYTGVLCSRTFMFLSRFQRVREYILTNAHVIALLETGVELLDDATVRPAAVVLGWPRSMWPRTSRTFFARLGKHDSNYGSTFAKCVESGWATSSDYTYWRLSERFLGVPEAKWTYWISDDLLQLFKELPSFEPTAGIARAGCSTGDDPRLVRYHWEVKPSSLNSRWKFFNKGGGYSRYYTAYSLVVDWSPQAVEIMCNQGNRLASRKHYFKLAISWPRISEKGTSFRVQPPDIVFSDKGPVFIPDSQEDMLFWCHLALLNSCALEGLLLALSHERSIDIGSVRSLPYVQPVPLIGLFAKEAYDAKAAWDTGNEICTRFSVPWLLQLAQPQSAAFAQGLGRILELLGDRAPPLPVSPSPSLPLLLDAVRAIEKAADARLQALQAQIDEAVYDLYEISPADRALIERELGERPPELVWPQMEGKSDREKRREHVRRFFSYYARQAVRGDERGIVPLAGCAAREPALVDRVRAQLEADFSPDVAYQMEQDAADSLGRPLEEWLRREFFRFHVKLYKNRPVLWHLTSPRGHFAVMLDYHRLDRDTLPKVQTLYLWPQMEAARSRLSAARAGELSVKAVANLEEELADLEECDRRLESVIQGTVKVDLPEWAAGPYRGGKPPYDPDLDDGVRVNLLPLQEAGLLPARKVV